MWPHRNDLPGPLCYLCSVVMSALSLVAVKFSDRSHPITHHQDHWTLPNFDAKWIGLSNLRSLSHWGRDKMAEIFQRIFSNAFSLMKVHEFVLRFHWSFFLRVQLTLSETIIVSLLTHICVTQPQRVKCTYFDFIGNNALRRVMILIKAGNSHIRWYSEMGSANERRCYIVMSSHIGWAEIQNDHCILCATVWPTNTNIYTLFAPVSSHYFQIK